MIPPKETKETLITDPQEMEIYELPKNELSQLLLVQNSFYPFFGSEGQLVLHQL